jgi:head-tail adaptor
MGEISAGELDKRVRLQRAIETRGAENEPVETWVEFARVWASRRDVLGKKTLANGEVVAIMTTVFKIRWSSDVSAISAQCRAVCDAEVYDVSDLATRGRRAAITFVGTKRND